MNKLPYLLKEKELFSDTLSNIVMEIDQLQIVKREDLDYYGFKKIKENGEAIICKKSFIDESYILGLNLLQPNIIVIRRGSQDRIHTFYINSIKDFEELLVFLNIF